MKEKINLISLSIRVKALDCQLLENTLIILLENGEVVKADLLEINSFYYLNQRQSMDFEELKSKFTTIAHLESFPVDSATFYDNLIVGCENELIQINLKNYNNFFTDINLPIINRKHKVRVSNIKTRKNVLSISMNERGLLIYEIEKSSKLPTIQYISTASADSIITPFAVINIEPEMPLHSFSLLSVSNETKSNQKAIQRYNLNNESTEKLNGILSEYKGKDLISYWDTGVYVNCLLHNHTLIRMNQKKEVKLKSNFSLPFYTYSEFIDDKESLGLGSTPLSFHKHPLGQIIEYIDHVGIYSNKVRGWKELFSVESIFNEKEDICHVRTFPSQKNSKNRITITSENYIHILKLT